MSEWGVALIAAGSALVGSLVTGWFGVVAGRNQAQAARHAGDRQADAMLETVRQTLGEQRALRAVEVRRETYARFLEAAETVAHGRRAGTGRPDDRVALRRALVTVELEGPEEAARAARAVAAALRGTQPPEVAERARAAFVAAARRLLGGAPGPGAESGDAVVAVPGQPPAPERD